jgi:hypothetical protein
MGEPHGKVEKAPWNKSRGAFFEEERRKNIF